MSIRRNTLYNLAGGLGSLAVSLVTIPLYLHQIGVARYGILIIVWLLLGYFGLFDLGLGRATAYAVAADDAKPRKRGTIIWSALSLNLLLGVFGGILLWAAGRVLLERVFHIPQGLEREVQSALPWIAAAVPLGTLASVLQGALQGSQKFLAMNAFSFCGSLLLRVVPLLVAYFYSISLAWIIPAAILTRAFMTIAQGIWIGRTLRIGKPLVASAGEMKRLLRYGGWVTVSGVIGPILDGFDRLVIGLAAGAQAVTYYAVPYSIATRPTILAGSLTQSMFPRLAAMDLKTARDLTEEGACALSAIATPLICIGMILMHPFLAVWIGNSFAAHATPIGEVLLAGIWFNLIAYVFLTHLQAKGQPDLPAKFHLLELIPYLAALWFAVRIAGALGAAVVWSCRVLTDTLLLGIATHLRIGALIKALGGGLVVLAVIGMLFFSNQIGVTHDAVICSALVLTACAWSLWIAPVSLHSAARSAMHSIRLPSWFKEL